MSDSLTHSHTAALVAVAAVIATLGVLLLLGVFGDETAPVPPTPAVAAEPLRSSSSPAAGDTKDDLPGALGHGAAGYAGASTPGGGH